MIIQDTWGQISTSFQNLLDGVIMFVPKLIVALIVFFIGWAIAVIVARAIEHFMKMVKFDEALQKAGVEGLVKRSGMSLNSGRFIGALVKYFVIVVFLMVSFDVLGLDRVTDFLRFIVAGDPGHIGFLPQLIISVLILLVGAVIGDVVSKIVLASARAADLPSANMLSVVARWGVWIFAIFIALSQMGIAADFINDLFKGLVVAVSLALGLSFGLGGQQAASEAINKVKNSVSSHH